LLTGESLFTTVFTNNGSGKAQRHSGADARAPSWPSTWRPGRRLICQKDAFLAAAKGVSIGIEFQKRS